MDYKTIIKKKENNKGLSYKEFKYIIDLYLKNDISEKEMTGFIKSIYEKGLNVFETINLTRVMFESGEKIDLSEVKKPIIDKHSTGGVGDKTSLIILPICASLGLCVPKMSGKSLGITGGTIDKLESIPGFKSDLSHKNFIEILNSVGCVDISQSEKIALADKRIYALRDKTGYVDSIPLIASSIMSKKIACSSKKIVIDLKVGNGAFTKDIKRATTLAKLMIDIGKSNGIKVVCVLTDMSSVLGHNVGNILEVKEAMNFFENKQDERLKKLIVSLCSYMLSISKEIPLIYCKKQVEKVMKNGEAKNKFYEWISSQGGHIGKMKLNAKRIDVRSIRKGYITQITAKTIGTLCTSLSKNGKKIDKNVGIILRKSIGDYVKENEVICSIFYNKEVEGMISKVIEAFVIKDQKEKQKSIILKVIK